MSTSQTEPQSDETAEGEGPSERKPEGVPASTPPEAGANTPADARPSQRPAGDGGQPLTAGARLAAAKAAKAAAKAARRGRGAERMEGEALKQAARLTDLLRTNRAAVLAGVAGALVLIGGVVGWRMWDRAQRTEAGAALWSAVEIASAPVVAPPEGEEEPGPADGEPERLTFPTATARAEKALEAFRKAAAVAGSGEAAALARLGEAGALLALAKRGEARAAYERVLRESANEPAVAARALEGIAFTFEGEEKWDEAITRFQELARLGRDTYQHLASYHLARMYLAKGDATRAKETLRTLLDAVRTLDAEGPGGPQLPFVRAQAELRLMALDPSMVPAGAGGPEGPGAELGRGMGDLGGAGGLTPEKLQELIRQLQTKGGAPGRPITIPVSGGEGTGE